jgi:ribose 5-phosphate isomerase RpiB
MRIAVLNEVSASLKNADILAALAEFPEHSVYNVGMASPEDKPELTYIQTGLMAALLLNAGACDLVVGGCGTGQGFLNSVLQYPGVTCGLLIEPLDAWLFSQINAGNCVSLALNKGYGWAGDLNLKLLFRELFRDPPGAGYPPHRSESQAESRRKLSGISAVTHRSWLEILEGIDRQIQLPLCESKAFLSLLGDVSATSPLAASLFRYFSELPSKGGGIG